MEDFLNDVAGAVENGGSIEETTTPLQSDVTGSEQTPLDVKPLIKEETNVAEELSSMFDKNDTSHIPGTEPKQEEKAQEPKQEENVSEQPQQQEPQNQFQRQPSGKKSGLGEKLLDTFLNEDENGNLVNNEGEIIATAGKSRHFYETLKLEGRKQRQAAQNLALSNMQLGEQFRNLYSEFQELKDRKPFDLSKETGLSDVQVESGIKLMKQYRQDPIGAIKSLLTQAQMDGIDIGQIGANISADPQALRAMLDEALEHRLGNTEKENSEESAMQKATQEANEFLQEFPQAAQHVDIITQAKQQFPNMPLREIWLRILASARNSQNKQQQQPVTKRRKLTTKPKTKVVTAPRRDYSAMSYKDIANSIEQDFK